MIARFTTLITALFLTTAAMVAETVTITDNDIQPGAEVSFTRNNTYILDGFVFVDSTATLTIESGTIIKGKPGEGANASALIVARGGKIYANGTRDQPIIFTAEADDMEDPYDLTIADRGLWGGLIILGNATINVAGGTEQIEGIPVTEPRGQYGGENDNDNSGVLRYISVRHGGSNIGANNEINGVTFGAVGNATVVDHIEVVANADDGFEWFGGTVRAKHLISAFNGDDAFDWDEGYRGKGQFWFAVQQSGIGNSAFECDGGTTPEDGAPYSTPELYNVTAIGSGAKGANAKNTPLLNLRDNSGGKFYNSVFMDGRGFGIQIEDLESGDDSRARLDADDLVFKNNVWYELKNGIADVEIGQQFAIDYLTNPENVNSVVDPQINSVSRMDDNMLDPRVDEASPVFSDVLPLPSGTDFFERAEYRGAFDANNLWARGWTFIDAAGYLVEVESGTIIVTDANIGPGDNVQWTPNNTYIIDGFVFVDSTATLTIEAGTVIKGKPGEGANASALIVARGATIYARGTETDPIIFTAEADDVDDPEDLTMDDRGLWGGVIVLGRATINVAGGTEQIEGIPVTESRGQYGGNNDEDNSGQLTYISIRHGGSNIGANNEINGLTFGGVGSNTMVHHIEVFANADDGYEFFGGTVNTKHLVSAFNGDDSFDWDEGFRGKGQYWFAIMDSRIGNSAFECDGGTTPEDGTPYSIPVLSHITAIGSGATGANAKNTPLLNLRDNSGGKFYNSIFVDGRGFAVNVEDLESGEDSRARLDAGDLVFENNIWNDFKDGIADEENGQQFLLDYLTTAENVNEVVDPQLTSVSRVNDYMLDPRPESGSPAFANVKMLDDGWFDNTSYRGAFGQGPNSNWLTGWTFIDASGIVTSVEEEQATLSSQSARVFPNPIVEDATIEFTAGRNSTASVYVVNTVGERVSSIATNVQVATGRNTLEFNKGALSNGAYLIVVQSEESSISIPFRIVR